MTGKTVFATRRISEKYTVMCHGNGLLVMTENGSREPDREAFGSSTLASGDARAVPPPLLLGNISCLAMIMGESFDSKHGLGLDGKAKRREVISDPRANLGRESRRIPDSRTGLIIGDSGRFPDS